MSPTLRAGRALTAGLCLAALCLAALCLAALCLAALAPPASAQSRGTAPPRIGVGFDAITAFYGQDVVPDGPSLGVRGRVALPVNADVSVAASLGIGAHVFEGSSDARYVINPQTSVIVTLPSAGSASVRYVLGGFGGFLPLSDGGGGPAIHAGAGLAFPLSQTSVYLEADPSLIIGEDQTVPVLAVRAGVIF